MICSGLPESIQRWSSSARDSQDIRTKYRVVPQRPGRTVMQQSTKMRAILVAGAALVAAGAAGAFATALGEETTNGGTAPIVSVGKMTLGGTATTTTPPTAVPIASPTLKASVPCGFTKGC